MGFNQVTPIEDSKMLEGIRITRTGGKHGPDELFEQLGKVSGFVLEAPDHPSIYIVGDCLWDEEVEKSVRDHAPDIIITNSGGALFMGGARILMDEEDTIKMTKAAPNAQIIAVHMEALDHCQTTRSSLKAAFEKEGLSVMLPADGESITL